MPTLLVNLDAMIDREDFETYDPTSRLSGSRKNITEIRIDDLEHGRWLYGMLRKPDFQRVTANWPPEKIADLVESFVNGEFIPSLIMWESTKSAKLFVIDGAHRLSALIAWVNNDYGDGPISRKFFSDDGISEPQSRYAKTTGDLVKNKARTYAEWKKYADTPQLAPDEQTRITARKIMSSTLQIQRVEGDAETAERSFFKINVSATMIDATELAILKARRLPNTIATRALIHAGRGHKFWLDFAESEQKEIERLAYSTHEVLFKPILEDPITTTELPIAGGSYSDQSFRMLIDLVNMVNNVTPRMWMEPNSTVKRMTEERLPADTTGEVTIRFLKKVERAANLISGREPYSLGLHPVVYFYGANGIFQPAALLAAIKFFTALDHRKLLLDFAVYRRQFEEFLAHHRHYINQLAKSKGSRTRPVDSLVVLYEIVLREVQNGLSDSEIIAIIRNDDRLKDLEDLSDEQRPRPRKRFSKDVRSAVYLKQAIESPVRCAVCGARMRSRAITGDHIKRIQDGGMGDEQNLQLTHFFCNTGVKESIHARRAAANRSHD